MTHKMNDDGYATSSSICEKCQTDTYVQLSKCLCNKTHEWCEKCWEGQ